MRVEGAQRKWCRKTSVFLSRETGMPGNFVGRAAAAAIILHSVKVINAFIKNNLSDVERAMRVLNE